MPTYEELKNSLEGEAPIMLYEITDIPNTTVTLYLTNYMEDVVFDGHTYTRFPISVPNIKSNSSGEVDSISVEISNVDREMQAYAEAYDGFRAAKVTFIFVFPELLDEPSHAIRDTYYVQSSESSADRITFNLSTKLDVLKKTIGRLTLRDRCPWSFKGENCGYTGSETFCDKTLKRCKELGNEENFGGFPGMPSQGRIIRI